MWSDQEDQGEKRKCEVKNVCQGKLVYTSGSKEYEVFFLFSNTLLVNEKEEYEDENILVKVDGKPGKTNFV